MNISVTLWVTGGDDGIRFSRELRARSSTVANVHRKFALYRFLFESLLFQYSTYLLSLYFGGDDGIRTHDPLLAGQVLSQLSYTPRKILRYCFSPFSIRSWRALDSQATFVPCLSLAVTSFLPFPLLAPSPSLSLPFWQGARSRKARGSLLILTLAESLTLW